MSRKHWSLATALGIGMFAASAQAVVNVALDANGGFASQSSTAFIQNGSGPADNGNDGNRDGRYNGSNGPNGSVTHTNNQAGAFWEVQLDGVFNLVEIDVWNRTDCCGDRIDPFNLTVFNGLSAVHVFNVPVFQDTINDGNPNTSGMQFLLPGTGVMGDRVRIQLQGTNFLHIAELEAWEEQLPPVVPEPASLGLLALAAGGLLARRRRA